MYSSSFSKLYLEIASKVKSKISVFLLNTRGSYGIRSFKDWEGKRKRILGTVYEKFEDCIYDLKSSLNLLKELGFREFVLLGHSTGAQKVVYYYIKEKPKDVEKLICLAPGDDYSLTGRKLGEKFNEAVNYARKLIEEGKENGLLLNYNVWKSAKRFLSIADLKNPEAQIFYWYGNLAWLKEIDIPCYIIFGENDNKALLESKEFYINKIRQLNKENIKLIFVPRADHSFTGKESELAEIIFRFL